MNIYQQLKDKKIVLFSVNLLIRAQNFGHKQGAKVLLSIAMIPKKMVSFYSAEAYCNC